MEVIIILVVIIIFGIVAANGSKLLGEINTEIQQEDTFSNQSKEMLSKNTASYSGVFDGLVVFMLFILTIAAIAFAFIIDTNPVFFVVTIVLLVVFIVAAIFLAQPFIETMAALEQEDNFPITYWIYNHLLLVVLMIMSLISIALYAKSRT